MTGSHDIVRTFIKMTIKTINPSTHQCYVHGVHADFYIVKYITEINLPCEENNVYCADFP